MFPVRLVLCELILCKFGYKRSLMPSKFDFEIECSSIFRSRLKYILSLFLSNQKLMFRSPNYRRGSQTVPKNGLKCFARFHFLFSGRFQLYVTSLYVLRVELSK